MNVIIIVLALIATTSVQSSKKLYTTPPPTTVNSTTPENTTEWRNTTVTWTANFTTTWIGTTTANGTNTTKPWTNSTTSTWSDFTTSNWTTTVSPWTNGTTAWNNSSTWTPTPTTPSPNATTSKETVICKNVGSATEDVDNYGDLICVAEEQSSLYDELLIRETLVNRNKEKVLLYRKRLSDVVIYSVNVLNFGRRHGFTTSVVIKNERGDYFVDNVVDVSVEVPIGAEVRLFIEIYGRKYY